MKPELQRIAIVEACPTVFVRPTGQDGWNYRNSVAGHILPCIDGDPLKTLSAMHEAEKQLRGWKRSIYWNTLGQSVAKIKGNADEFDTWKLITATAAQRAEAFLKTIGKWKD